MATATPSPLKQAQLKLNPPVGRLPALQFMLPGELAIDAGYQRSIDNDDSQRLIRRIAVNWNWDLCQPLVVSRRDGQLYVIDGQHRLAAAKLRGDIGQLPCVVVEYATAAEEAANFVNLNQNRRALSPLDLFKAALASGDTQAVAIMAALGVAGLQLAPHTNCTAWKPGMVGNVGGIVACWRKHGAEATCAALDVLARAFAGEVLQYAGTLFPGIAAICAFNSAADNERLIAVLGTRQQAKWYQDIVTWRAAHPEQTKATAPEQVIGQAFAPDRFRQMPAPDAEPMPVGFVRGEDGKSWCAQCEMRVTLAEAQGCKSRWCSLKVAA